MRITVLLLTVFLLRAPAFGFIERLFSLKEMLDQSTHVLVGRIESVDARRGTAVAVIDRALKGKKEFSRIRMNLGVAPKEHVRYLVPRLKAGGPFVILYQRDKKNLASCCHAGDTWFQLFGSDNPARRSKVWWRMSHLEIYLTRTYNGNTSDFVKLVEGVLAGRIKSPKPDKTVPRLSLTGKRPVAKRPRQPETPRPTPARKPSPPKPRTPVDGLEALEGWTVDESWSRPGKLTIRNDGGRGKVMNIACKGETGKKLALAILHHMDVSAATRVNVAVAHSSKKPLRLSVAFGAAPDWQMHETPPVVVPPSTNPRPVSFRLDRPHFKSEASRWKHTRPIPNEGRIDKMMILVEGLPQKGRIRIDGLRLGAGGFSRTVAFPHRGGEARGIAWADVNGDERLDAVVCVQRGNLLLVNQGDGTFRDQSTDFGLTDGSRSASWADYNGDGHPDLLTNNFRLFTHAGGRLRDDSKLLTRPKGRNPEGAGWIDYNGDGRPDVLITNGQYGILLYENTGKGPRWFRDVSRGAGLGPKGIGTGNGDFVAFADVDGDGYTDFFYNLGKGILAVNDGEGKFTVDAGSKISLPGDGKRGLAFADYDRDGDVDCFMPGPMRPRLYRNNNDGTFTDVLAASGDLARAEAGSFSATWGDVNRDGVLDLFVCRPTGPSRLYLGDGKGKFTDAVAPGGFDGCFAASFADVDGDGDLDLLMNQADRAVLAFNDLDLPDDAAALMVDVRAERGTTGAVVRVSDAAGRHLGYHELTGAQGCGGQASATCHFGVKLKSRLIITVGLSDGRTARKTATIAGSLTHLTFREADFK